MNCPDVSVLMCVRNGEAYLKEALDGVAGQFECECMEVVVIDDGSTDSSGAILRDHGLEARLIEQGPLGHPFALNRGVAEARGAYVAFIDADDVWPAGRLRALVAAFERNPDYDCIFGLIHNTDVSLRPLSPPFPARLPTSGLIRRSAFARVGDFRTDIRHASNVDWISRANAAGLRFGSIDEVVLLRRIHGANMGIVDVTKGRSDMLRVIRDHHARTRK